MDISQTRFSGRSKVFALCLCFSNSKKRIVIFISYERLLTLPPKKPIFIGCVEIAEVVTVVEGINLSPANTLIRRVIIERKISLLNYSRCAIYFQNHPCVWLVCGFRNGEQIISALSRKAYCKWLHTAELHGLSQVASQIQCMEAAQWSRHQLYWGLLMTAAQLCFELGTLCFGIALSS